MIIAVVLYGSVFVAFINRHLDTLVFSGVFSGAALARKFEVFWMESALHTPADFLEWNTTAPENAPENTKNCHVLRKLVP